MSCNCCCTKTLFLCKVPSCGEIDFGITAQLEGVHQMVVPFLGVQHIVEKFFEVDDPLTFPVSSLNENYTFNAMIIEPDGKQIIIRKEEVDYDCFQFQTVVSYVTIEAVIPEP